MWLGLARFGLGSAQLAAWSQVTAALLTRHVALPLLTLLTTYLPVLVIRMHHVTSFLLISYCTLVSTFRSISQLIPKPLTDPGHLIVLYLYI